jgi:hypothetical protein
VYIYGYTVILIGSRLAGGINLVELYKNVFPEYSEVFPEAGHILYLRILYPIHIQAQKKDIISYPYPGPKKGYGYISYILCQKFCQPSLSF